MDIWNEGLQKEAIDRGADRAENEEWLYCQVLGLMGGQLRRAQEASNDLSARLESLDA